MIKEPIKHSGDNDDRPKEKADDRPMKIGSNFRKVYLKIDGVDHMCFVP